MNPETLAKAGTEHAHQVAFFAWCAVAARQGFRNANTDATYSGKPPYAPDPVPALDLIHAVHNQGHGDRIRGARAKAEGVRAGIPDIFWPRPTGGYAGLYVEMKKPGVGRLSPEQRGVIAALREQGYKVVVAYGWREATQAVVEYCTPQGVDS